MRTWILFAGLAAFAQQPVCAQVETVAASGAAKLQFRFRDTRGVIQTLVLDGFRLDGRALGQSNAPQVRQIASGVTEVTALSDAPAGWEFALADDSSYYGFGERFDRLNQAHAILRNASRDTAGNKGTHTYQPVPFFMSLRGYGLWVDTFSEATFDLNVADPTRVAITVYARKLRFVLFEGPTFPAILERFTALTGRQQLPPYWAFAPWKSRDYYRNRQEVQEDADRYRELGLPASVILIDSPWATNYNTYVFNSKQFDDGPGMVAYLHRKGYKVVFWHTSWINRETSPPYEDGIAGKIPLTAADNFAEAERNGYFLQRPDGSTYLARWWKGLGSLIDFTNPAATKWWQSQVSKAIAMGADGFKDDDGEGIFIGDVKFASGEDPRLVRNRYAVDYNHAVAEVLAREKGKDWVLFQRSGTTGSHMLPLFWCGDNDATFSPENGLPTVVTAGLSAGMSGFSLWMSDLGGYNKTARFAGDNVLFARWTEYSAFSPGMEVMSGMNLGPWDYGEETLGIFRKYSVLHMSLFPYRYAAAQESARNGLPMMRALALMHQDDANAREAANEYYFGPDLLVAPVLAPVTQRAVYLPEGNWIDYWTGKRIKGLETLVVDAPLDRIPVFVRDGAILPKIPEDVMTLVPDLDARRVYEIYPGKLRAIRDFEGRSLAPGADPDSLLITGPPARITLRWRFQTPGAVTLDGTGLHLVTDSPSGVTVEFDHKTTSRIHWRQ